MRDRTDRHQQRNLVSIAATSVALLVVLAAGPARAQSAEAEAVFNDGNKLMAEGKLAQACDAFAASNTIEARAGTLIRLGECREQNHELASAWSAYKDALTRVKDPKKRAVAAARVAALEPKLSYLTVSVSDDSRVDGLTLTRNGKPFDAVLWNRALPVDGGDYIIAGRAPGHEEWQTTAHVPVDSAKISVEVPKFKDLVKLAPPTTTTPPPTTPATNATTNATTTPVIAPPVELHDDVSVPSPGLFSTTRRKVALGAAVVTVAGVVVGTLLGESAKSKQTDAYKLCPSTSTPCGDAAQSDALITQSRSRALDANITFGVAAAAAIGAGVLWFTGAPSAEDSRRLSFAPSLLPGETGVVVMGRF